MARKFSPGDEGKVVDGRLVVFLKPPRYRSASAQADKRDSAAAGQLKNPTWSQRHFRHGEVAALSVEAPASLQGRMVTFTVERRPGNATWSQCAELRAPVRNGKASATYPMEHPKGTGNSLREVRHRFHARLS